MLEQYIQTVIAYAVNRFRDSLLERMVLEKEEERKVELGDIPQEMRDLIGEDHPFGVSEELLQTALEVTYPHPHPLGKAKAIYRWIVENISYDHTPLSAKDGYRNAREVFEQEKGVCGELAYLYIAMARTAGLDAGFMSIMLDYRREWKQHACAEIRLGKERVMVDLTMPRGGFGVKHQGYARRTDTEALADYLAWNGCDAPRWLEEALQEERAPEEELWRYTPLAARPSSRRALPALALVLALGAGSAGVYAGGKAFMDWWFPDRIDARTLDARTSVETGR